MTCRTAILAARRHALTCGMLEECAPPVTAPYLAAAVERCKLPIKVWYEHSGQEWLSGQDGWVVSLCRNGEWEHFCSPSQSTEELTRVYSDLVQKLSPQGSSSVASPATDDAALASAADASSPGASAAPILNSAPIERQASLSGAVTCGAGDRQ